MVLHRRTTLCWFRRCIVYAGYLQELRRYVQFSVGSCPVKILSFPILTKWIEKSVLKQSESSIFTNSTNSCCLIGRRKSFPSSFLKGKITYQTYQDKFHIARNLYSVLAVVNSLSHYVFLCSEVSRTVDIASLSLRWPMCQLDNRRRYLDC